MMGDELIRVTKIVIRERWRGEGKNEKDYHHKIANMEFKISENLTVIENR